jgi:O-antigen/teichoic acid export membrane protein
VYGTRYTPYAEPARLFALVELLVLPVSVLFLEAAVRRLQRFIILVHLWSGFILCTLGIFLIVQLGLFGVAVTTAVALTGQIAVLALILARAQRQTPKAEQHLAEI